ncbi:MAG: ferritin family protein [Acidaminobacteraceae bacterium]
MSELILIEDILNALIALEEKSSKNYDILARNAESIESKTLFETLSIKEQEHKEIYEMFKKDHVLTEEVDEEYSGYVDALLHNSFYEELDFDFKYSFEEGIRYAMNLERDTIIFLNEIKSFANIVYAQEIEQLKNEEKKHLRILNDIKKQYLK